MYCGVVKYLPGTYVTDNVIAEANTDIIKFKQPVGQRKSNTFKCSGLRTNAEGSSTTSIATRDIH